MVRLTTAIWKNSNAVGYVSREIFSSLLYFLQRRHGDNLVATGKEGKNWVVLICLWREIKHLGRLVTMVIFISIIIRSHVVMGMPALLHAYYYAQLTVVSKGLTA